MEGPICQPDPTHREVCWAPETQVRDMAKKLPSLILPTDYYPLLVFLVGTNEVPTRRLVDNQERPHGLGTTGQGIWSPSCVPCSPAKCREWWGKKQENHSDEHQAGGLVLPADFWGFWSWAGLCNRTCWQKSPPVPKGIKDLSSGLSRASWESFYVELKGEQDHSQAQQR